MLKSRLLGAVGIVAVIGGIAVVAAQTPQSPAFDAASVKTHQSDDQRTMMVAEPGGRFVATNIPLLLFIRTAYRLQDDQIVGGPGWLNSERFDIVAKADAGATVLQLPSMMQALLVDRFKMAVHHETRELPIYALVLARGDGTLGAQLRRNDCDPSRDNPPGPPDPTHQRPCGSISNGVGRLTIRAIPIGQILQFLSSSVNRVVLDRTGLAGNFDLDLQWTPDLPQGPSGGRPPGEPPLVNGQSVDPIGPSIFTALQEQLGLRLQSTTGPVDVIVIDTSNSPRRTEENLPC